MYPFSIKNFLIYIVEIIRIEFAIQEDIKRIIIYDKLSFISNYPSKLSKNCHEMHYNLR